MEKDSKGSLLIGLMYLTVNKILKAKQVHLSVFTSLCFYSGLKVKTGRKCKCIQINLFCNEKFLYCSFSLTSL